MSDYNSLMIDIETLNNGGNSVITSLAAVAFNSETGKIGPEFMVDIDIQNSLNLGFEVNASTILWWMQQSDEARNLLVEGQKKALKVEFALYEFTSFVQSLKPQSLRVFGNGAKFDLGILSEAYYKIRKGIPWKHTMERDVRTIVEFAPEIKTKWLENFQGIKHNPIDDCKCQIGYVCEILNKIKIE